MFEKAVSRKPLARRTRDLCKLNGAREGVEVRWKIVDVHTNFLQKRFTLQFLAGKIRETLARGAAAATGSH